MVEKHEDVDYNWCSFVDYCWDCCFACCKVNIVREACSNGNGLGVEVVGEVCMLM